MPNPLLLVYLPYAVIAITLTIWLARTLSRHGGVFLRTVFKDKPELADAINQLLVIGFYLVNIGWALLLLRANEVEAQVHTATDATALLTTRLGTLLLLLGVAHLANLYVFHRVRRGAETPELMPAKKPPQKKSDATRARLLARALSLFQKKGVEATTMRDIAKAAGMSLGAAYYYFPSKEALVFAYYEDNQHALEQLATQATGTVRERLGTIFHGKLETIRPQKKMLAAIVQRLVDPSDPVGAFSAQTRNVRDRAMAVLEQILADAHLPPDVVPLATRALWLLQMAMMLVYVNDDSPGEQRTHGLVDDALDMIVPMLPMLATPMGKLIVERVNAALEKAKLV